MKNKIKAFLGIIIGIGIFCLGYKMSAPIYCYILNGIGGVITGWNIASFLWYKN